MIFQLKLISFWDLLGLRKFLTLGTHKELLKCIQHSPKIMEISNQRLTYLLLLLQLSIYTTQQTVLWNQLHNIGKLSKQQRTLLISMNLEAQVNNKSWIHSATGLARFVMEFLVWWIKILRHTISKENQFWVFQVAAHLNH